MSGVRRVFTVDGKPFFPLGGQARNSSGYTEAEAATAIRAVGLLGGNTLEIPVYWEQVEPEEGRFDFTGVDSVLTAARASGLRLILLWFATWKNGDMDYAPAWVKTDPRRFHRVTAPSGKTVWVLSSHCAANLHADRRAFVALCRHLAAADAAERTVIGLQIENEPGILGSDRDYGPDGQADWAKPVPEAVMALLREQGGGPLHQLWRNAGAKAGTWAEVFGWAGGEVMTAWSIARYIDAIAEAGKAAFDVPMYANVWLGEVGWRVAGDSYPSGGAVSKVLDVYKACAPHLDLIAPDIYLGDSRSYEAVCRVYKRPDNPLFVPESPVGGTNAGLMFRALAEHDAIGYFCFGVERLVAADGSLRPEAQEIAGSFRCAAAITPLLLEHQGAGRIHAVMQDEGSSQQYLDLDGYAGVAFFDGVVERPPGKDWRHPAAQVVRAESAGSERARGLIVQVSRNELYVVGSRFRLVLRPKVRPEHDLDATVSQPWLLPRCGSTVSVDEGHFDAAGRYVVDRRRNGDEIDYGIWVEPDTGVVRAVMTE
jgi:hypothetical protein